MSEAEQTADGDGFGLDKKARVEAKWAKAVEDQKPEPLDPPFPYRVIAFDPVMITGT
jgi:hypothetical protein